MPSPMPIPKGWPKPPFMLVDTASVAGTKLIILGRSALAWLGVEYSPYDVVRDVVVHDRHTSRGPAKGKRFHPWEHNTNLVTGSSREFKDHVEALRKLALRDGATPEAIRLLDGDQPFTTKEVIDMADKLAKKSEKPAAKAKEAPKGKTKGGEAAAATEKPKGKGNAEALAKARAARAEAGPDTRKITVVKKENPYREGSGRADSWNIVLKAKTAEDYKSAGGKAKYLQRWADEGLITLK